jgi:alanyl-tRNA synthetase
MPSTERLYYHDSLLYDFNASVVEVLDRSGRSAIVLDRTAFYPTSGGQVHDTGTLMADGKRIAVSEVADDEDGRILHFVTAPLPVGSQVQGSVDAIRRRDHVQQHSGQHVLSAAFIRLFNMPTISFHMGEESCTIDLDTSGLSTAQAQKAELLANDVIAEDRPVNIRFVPLEQARQLGLRKLPPKQTGDLRLIDIADFDLTACGGTHVGATGQIGAILLRKVEKVKQSTRVEFVCGLRAVSTARRDYTILTETATLYSSHIRDVPEQVRKSLAEIKSAGKSQHKLLEELAELYAERLLSQASGSPRIITQFFSERDALFIKLLAQKLTAGKADAVALLASGGGQPTLVFAQSPGQKFNMGQLMKDAMVRLGGRGGGAVDMAQGGLPSGAADLGEIEKALLQTEATLRARQPDS